MVLPHKFGEFDEIIVEFVLNTKTLTENLQVEIDEEVVVSKSSSNSLTWTRYNSLEEIYDWLDELVGTYPYFDT